MPVESGLEDKLVQKLRKRDSIRASGRLECQVAHMIGLGRTNKGYAKARHLLERLEGEGKVVIERSGPSMRKVMLVPALRASSHPTQKVETIIEQTGLPSTEEPMALAVMKPAEKVKLGRINLALCALQQAADSEGKIKGATAPIIAAELKITLSQASDLNRLLADMGRRREIGSRSDLVQEISQDEKEITIEELRAGEAVCVERRKRKRERKQSKAVIEPAAQKDAQPEEQAEPASAETQVIRGVKPDGPSQTPAANQPSLIDQLTDIIVKLNERVGNRDRTIKDLQRRLKEGGDAAREVIRRLNEDNTQLKEDVRKLTDEIERVGKPSELTERLLSEFSGTTDE